MNIIKTLRKPQIAMFLAFLVLFVSCNQTDNETVIEQNKINETALKDLHQSIIVDFENAKESKNKPTAFNDELFVKAYSENAKFVNEFGLESLLIKNKIDPTLYSQFDFYIQNESKDNVYQLMLDKFEINTIEEATFLFNTIELTKIIQENLKGNKSTLSAKTQISWGCAFAIAGTVAVTVGVIFATSGTALLYSAGIKVLATVAIIEACGEGWGEI